MPDKPSTIASDFLAAFFGAGAAAPVFVTSLENVKSPGGGERTYVGRDRASIDGFIRKWDRDGRGTFFCVGTIRPGAQPMKAGGSVRHKENIAEIVCCHADTDLKGIEVGREAVIAALMSLELPPSVIVWSGRGAHSYWLFNEPLEADPDTIARVEAMSARLSDVVGGDPVQDVTRLMRLPGSRNTKEGVSHAVEVIHARFAPRYEIGDVEEWLDRAAPVIARKAIERSGSGKAADVADNPWLAVAAAFGFKPPIDIEKRLEQMSYQGTGDTSIHNTQLAVSAALLNQGEDVEDVVEMVLQATRAAAGADGRNWRWDREEKTIRGMCLDWRRKHPEAAQKPAVERPVVEEKPKAQAREATRDDAVSQSAEERREATTGAVVHHLAEERQKREKPKRRKAGDGAPVHIVLGEAVLEAMRRRGQSILFMRKAAWIYEGGLWSMEVDGLKSWLDVQIEIACRALNIDGTNRVRSEARGYIQASPDLWRDDVAWDAHGKIPTRSGLVNLTTGEVEAARAEHYCTWRVEADFDRGAACPLWLEMVGDTFADRSGDGRSEIVAALQEILGSALIDVKPRALSKALCLVGGSNYGKSGLLEVFGGLFGENTITAGLESLEGSHGLMPFMRRAPWVLHEAFDQRKWHFSSTVKAIVTSEPVSINVKNGPILTQRVRAPIFWGTNHPPQFREATRAIVNRLIVIHCRREFLEGEFVGIAAEARKRGLDRPSTLVLAVERSGLLNWAIEGLRRALERGSILVNDEIRGNADEIHRDSNLAAGFIEECVSFDRERRVSVPDFCAAFSVWWLENKGEDRSIPSNDAIGKAVNSLGNAMIASDPKDTKDKSRRYLCGIVLNEEGLSFWERAKEAKAFEGKTASVETSVERVNSYTPEGWFSRPTLDRMARAHADDTSRKASVTSRISSVTPAQVSPLGSVTQQVSPVVSPGQVSPGQATDTLKKPQF